MSTTHDTQNLKANVGDILLELLRRFRKTIGTSLSCYETQRVRELLTVPDSTRVLAFLTAFLTNLSHYWYCGRGFGLESRLRNLLENRCYHSRCITRFIWDLHSDASSAIFLIAGTAYLQPWDASVRGHTHLINWPQDMAETKLFLKSSSGESRWLKGFSVITLKMRGRHGWKCVGQCISCIEVPGKNPKATSLPFAAGLPWFSMSSCNSSLSPRGRKWAWVFETSDAYMGHFLWSK